MGHLGLIMAHPHNSRSSVRIVLQFCAMKAAKREFSEKKILFKAVLSF